MSDADKPKPDFRRLIRALRTEDYKKTPLWQLQERQREKAAAEAAKSKATGEPRR